MKISVLTATYNRAKYLNKLYNSIVSNICNGCEVEWLIMDDGSNDETETVCRDFQNVSGLEVKYYKQENQGKMAAINNLAKYVTGELWIECDSDDFFEEGAFETIANKYESLKDRNDIYAMAFLKKNQSGKNMGNDFSQKETTMFDLYFKHQEDGEKALVFITVVRQNYRYELEHGERFVTEARMYHKLDKSYKIACVNEYVMICEYQAEGYSKNIEKQFLQNPYGYYKYFYEILADMNTSHIAFSKRLYAIKHYILFTYLTGNRLNLKVKGGLNKILILLLYIPGCLKSKKYKNERQIN